MYEASDDQECFGTPRDLCESFELSQVRIGLETTELFPNSQVMDKDDAERWIVDLIRGAQRLYNSVDF